MKRDQSSAVQVLTAFNQFKTEVFSCFILFTYLIIGSKVGSKQLDQPDWKTIKPTMCNRVGFYRTKAFG